MKERKITPTPKQRKLVERMFQNSTSGQPQSLEAIKDSVGYGKIRAGRIIKSKGVIQLFKEAGISGKNLATEWNKVLMAKPDKVISWDSKIKGLAHISRYILENPESKIAPQIQFIDKFLNLQVLRQNRPKLKTGLKDKESGA